LKSTILAGVAITCLLSGLSAEAAHVEARVSAYHRLGSIAGQTFAVVPTKEQEASLEWDSLAKAVGDELVKAGAVITPRQDAKYLLSFSYFMGAQGTQTVNLPMFGQTGVSSAMTTGSVRTSGNTATFSGNTTYTPSFGVTGFMPLQLARNERVLVMTIFDRGEISAGATKPVYEGKVSSIGSCDDVPIVVPFMVTAAFQEFPGESGKPKMIKVAVPREAKKSCRR